MAQDDEGRGSSLLMGTLKVAAAVAFLSYCASSWLAGTGLDQQTLSRLAAASARSDDPVTTGSLGRSAGATRLDPCALSPSQGRNR